MTGRDADERFLDEAVARGLLAPAQADDCRRLLAALGEVDVTLTLDEVLARKGFLDRERSAELRRALARQRVGRYEVIERLGEGGSGVVWKARDVVLDRLVALKLLSREARGDAAWRERFLREARTAVTLNHASIVRGLDCGEADGYLFFAMEYVPGETVAARLRREGRLAEKDALRIALETVRALRYVAGLGIVHRDLKPENLIVAEGGRVKVCDLGLAKPTLEEADRGATDAVVAGTPLYIAPEQVRDGEHVDWRADVYSLGATLYHMLAGRPPFLYEPGRDLLRRHLEEVPPSPREFALDLTPNAAAVVLKMLQKDPADRYARIEDLEEDLESVLAGRPPRHTISFAPKERPQVDAAAARAIGAGEAARRPRRWVPVVATLFALAVVAVAGVLTGSSCYRQLSVNFRLSSPEPAPPRPGPPPRPAEPPAPPAAPTTSPSEAEAMTALETARRLASRPAADLRARLDAFRFVVERWPGTSAAEIAAGVVSDLDAEIERTADAALDQARGVAAEHEAAGRLGEAMRVLDGVSARHPGTEAADAAGAESRRLRDAAGLRLRALLDASRDALAASDFAAARRALDEAVAIGLPGSEREIALHRRAVAEAREKAERSRAETAAAFDRAWGAAVLAAHAEGVEAALRMLDAARADFVPWAREIDLLRVELLAMAATPDAPPAGASLLDLHGVFFARLSRGDLAGAQAMLDRIETDGGPADDLRPGIGRVRAVLAMRADELLAGVRPALVAQRPDEADRLVRAAFAVVPAYPRARVAAAAVLAARGRTDEAVDELRSVLELAAPPPEAHLRLAEVLATRASGLEEAQQEIDRFLAAVPEGDPLRTAAADVVAAVTARRRAQRAQECRAALRTALRAADTAAAIAAGEELVAMGEADRQSLVDLGDAYSDAGRVHDAFLVWRRASGGDAGAADLVATNKRLRRLEQRAQAAPESHDAATAARRLLDAGDVEAAREAYDAVLLRAPFLEEALAGDAEAWLTRKGSGAYALADDPRRALRLTEVLLLRNPDHVRGMELRAEALLRTGSAKDALTLASKACELDVARPDPATTAGFAALRLDDPAGALGWFKRSLDRRPTPQARYGRALAWEDLHHTEAARAEALMLVETFGVPPDMKDDVEALLGRLGLEAVDAPDAPR